MSNLRNTELKTKSKLVSSKTSAINIGSQVPSGMKRWVTFLAVDGKTNSRISNFILYLASVGVSNPTRASIVATANRKRIIALMGTELSRSSKKLPIMEPTSGPDPENPLFSIASGKWLGAYLSLTTGNLTVQYFDE